MSSLIVSIILFVVVFAGLCVTIVYNQKRRSSNLVKSKPWSKKSWLLLPLSLLVFTILLPQKFVQVNANEVGIIYDDRYGVLETVKSEGFQSKSIFEHITRISTINKTAQLSVAGQTKDSIYADFVITIVYRIDADKAGKFFKKTAASDISSEQLNSLAKEALQGSTIKYDIYGILGDKLEDVRLDFVNSITRLLMERYYITVVSASFDDIDAGEAIETAIRKKAEALQQIEIAEAEQQRVEIENETARLKAQAQADIVRIAAEAQANKTILEKTAISEMIAQYREAFPTLTEKEVAQIILQTIYYDTWNGELPQVLTNDALSALMGSIITGG
jgi:regulator of protease activity HflC (stomatin/prohibitin superfamily)